MIQSASTFWQFSLRFYRRPGVADACLRLQDTAGVDVNLLFFLLFLSIHGRQLTTDEVRRIDARISDWRTRVVQPLRRIRRDLKSGIVPVDAQAAEALRSAIKRDELAAERVQQETLELEFPTESTGTRAAPHIAAVANIAAYGVITAWDTLPDDPVNTLLKALAEEFF